MVRAIMADRSGYRLTGEHKQRLLTGLLLWFALVLSRKNSYDGWAANFEHKHSCRAEKSA
jgi:hypothetical protein